MVSYLLERMILDYEVHLIVFEKQIEYKISGLQKIRITTLDRRLNGKYLSVLLSPVIAWKIKSYLRSNNINTILSFLNRPNTISCLLKPLGWKGRVVISERVDTKAYYATVRLGNLMLGLIKLLYPLADQIIVISKGIQDSLKSIGVNNTSVIYNPIVLPQEKKSIESPHFTFINIARLEAQKNQSLLIKSFARVKDQSAQLYIVGEGSLDKLLRKIAFELGVQERVHFVGYQSEVGPWLQASDCMVFSSDYEGFGNVILEALSYDVPVISTDCPSGPREILAPDTVNNLRVGDHFEVCQYGLLTPVGDVDSLTSAMNEIQNNKELRDQLKGSSAKRVNDFDLSTITNEYYKIIENERI